jgi:hypothetical protein
MLDHVGICKDQEMVPVLYVPCMSRISLVFAEGLREIAETGKDSLGQDAKPGGYHQDIVCTGGEIACITEVS